ncbi:hypothetical protein TSOC_006725 [Tetrabaena socialis]|uniref:phytol kinase n=1 Tax=Tetrabaena socialis TaxID=47790 RepID=A0A2J8A2X3_9CHLO|nr:hypothetical protein TSOC_006725 [Tetrabaena socialis]|eukprot:PNH06872.1 hypothetical protein TSOC_006725 [Tetrabaena socialis]
MDPARHEARAARGFMDLSSEGAAVASAVLADGAARAALLRVVAAAVRRPLTAPSSGSRSEGSGSVGGSSGGTDGNQGSRGRGVSTPDATTALLAQTACGTTSILLHLLTMQPPPSAAALDFVQKLLRMQMLHCLACRIAEAVADAGGLTAQQLELVECYVAFLCSVMFLCSAVGELATFSIESGPVQLPLLCLCRHLAEALLDSSVVEHLVRLVLLLLLQRAPAGNVETARSMARFTFDVCQNISAMHQYFVEDGDAAACAVLRQVLSGRCVRHVLLAHGVAALCAADGGPTYGLPDAVRQAALEGCMEEAGPTHPEQPLQLQPAFVYALQAVLGNGVPLTAVGTRVAVFMMLRLGRLVVASSGGEGADQQAWLRSVLLPAQPAGPRVVVPLEDVLRSAIDILASSLRLLQPLLAVGAPAWVAEAAADCWRLVVAVISRSFLRLASARQLEQLGTRVLLGGPLSSAASPVTAAALAGGVLPCLERLLRRAGEEPPGPESDVVKAMLRCERSWQLWSLLLAYGEQRQAAALVATVGKLLRRMGTGAATKWSTPVTDCAGSMFTHALETPAAPEQEQGRPGQLPRMLMYAVCEWLPALSRIALQLMAAPVARRSADGPAQARNVLAPLLAWLPPLLLRCRGADGGATAGTTMAGATDAAGPASCAADDLRLLLLKEVRAVPLLGGALRLVQHSTVSCGLRLSLAETCCLVAATWPEEVRRAVCADAAGADDGGSAGTASDGAAAVAPPQLNPPPPPSSSVWPPELLRALVPHLRKEGAEQVADGVLALAQLLEAWDTAGISDDGSSSGGCNSQEAQARGRLMTVVAWMHDTAAGRDRLAANLGPPAEARALLRTCSYRGCTRLAGDSEAEARLQACGWCGAAWYCCRACQLSHWREGGHKKACTDGSRPRSD